MDIYTVTIIISIVVYVAIGNYAGRGVRGLDDYYVAGRRAPTLVIVGTLVASLMSATMFLGEAGFSYAGQAGPYMLWPQTPVIGYVLGAILFGRYLRRSRATTVAAFFGERFASRRVQAIAGYTIVFALGGYLLAVTQGAGILLSEITDLTYTQALIVAWLSYTFFTIYSGSRGVILTDTLMFLLFSVASVGAIIFLVSHFGGWIAVLEGMTQVEGKAGLMSWHGIIGEGTYWPTAADYLIWGVIIDLSWLMVYAVSPWQSSRHLMARNEHVVMRAAIIACLVVVLLQVLVYGLGGMINLGNPNIEPYERATIWASLNLLPPILGALMLAGITAAALSSASTFLSLVGFSATQDIGLFKDRSDAQTLTLSRVIMLGLGALALAVALVSPPDIFWLMIFIGTIFASSWGPVAIMSIWSRRLTEAGAFWGMLAGLLGNVVLKFFEVLELIVLPSYLEPALIGVVCSLTVAIVVSRNTTVSHAEADYLKQLHETPAEDVSEARTRWTLWAPAALLLVNGLVMPYLLLNYYVFPYQRISGQLTPDGSINWAYGEPWVASSWCGVYVTLSLLAMWVIRRDYRPGRARPANAGEPVI